MRKSSTATPGDSVIVRMPGLVAAVGIARCLDVDRVHARLAVVVAAARVPRPFPDDDILEPADGDAAPLSPARSRRSATAAALDAERLPTPLLHSYHAR